MIPRAGGIPLLILLVLAGCLRLVNLGDHGLWWDEFLSLSSACGSVIGEPIEGSGESFQARHFWQDRNLSNVVRAVGRQDSGNGIVYHVLLYAWATGLGTRDGAVRLLSVLCSVLIVWVGFCLSSRLFIPSTAWWTTGLLAVHPLLVRYGQEARPYALATLFSLGASLLLVQLWGGTRRSPEWSSALYGVAMAAALMSHYLTLSIFAGHALFAVLRGETALLRRVALSGCVAAVLVAAWLTAAGSEGLSRMVETSDAYRRRAESTTSGENFALPSRPANLAAGSLQVAYQLSGNALQNSGLRLRDMIPLLAVPALFLTACWLARHRIQRVKSGLLLVGILAVSGPLASAALALLAGHIVSFQSLYGSFGAPYVAMLLAAGMSQAIDGRRIVAWLIRGGIVAQAIVVLFSLRGVYDDAPRHRPPNQFAAIAAELARRSELDTVTYPTWTEARLVNLYMPQTAAIHQRVDGSVANGFIRLDRADGIVVRYPRPPL